MLDKERLLETLINDYDLGALALKLGSEIYHDRVQDLLRKLDISLFDWGRTTDLSEVKHMDITYAHCLDHSLTGILTDTGDNIDITPDYFRLSFDEVSLSFRWGQTNQVVKILKSTDDRTVKVNSLREIAFDIEED